ncbi:DNA/RNA nuclease SfsA [Corallincola holothuriorum]|uniref:Sugar fermentation stimulation protein homolog n=1 Tax=Corallincola holothuriorum TaxID=2282215 RepID=A0A368NQ61_9GAMM|nr:DNA/RNA nuclease SfsA [Corallincola holothuriorum]RCU51609.1 DNA/RNA nuclease SfsA [Corallincola holothuriorum]
MKFTPPLEKARLLQRYKRFLADVELENGELMTLHCANTGAMTGCIGEHWPVFFSLSDDPKRKLPGSLQLTQNPAGDLICVNTALANKLVAEALADQRISELRGYATVRREVKYGSENSRVDFLLSDHSDSADCYLEVKMATLLQEGQGYFPDAATTRGQKHLRELIEQVKAGCRAVLLFCVTHTGIHSVKAAAHIDPVYAKTLDEAVAAGVEVICYGCDISRQQIVLDRSLTFG